MRYKLLLSMEVVTYLEGLKAPTRRGLRDLIGRIEDDPLGSSEAIEYDSVGRLMHIAIEGENALIY